ncbi:hypothetical protein Cflav_PD5031 [Pedosphaera parvula Ellin514]|uniref:Uncharacterized protein n=1 Tax=Pedosphaera parvula (strain Ellin514) TaxID=320771 RepID=B9XD50_PEDPL|nr:hypothetical protein Cflav_PD5031 [Pedosphaera parvula Ellin514]
MVKLFLALNSYGKENNDYILLNNSNLYVFREKLFRVWHACCFRMF